MHRFVLAFVALVVALTCAPAWAQEDAPAEEAPPEQTDVADDLVDKLDEEPPAEEAASEEPPSEEAPSEDAASEDAASEEAASEETPGEEAASEEAASEVPSADEAVAPPGATPPPTEGAADPSESEGEGEAPEKTPEPGPPAEGAETDEAATAVVDEEPAGDFNIFSPALFAAVGAGAGTVMGMGLALGALVFAGPIASALNNFNRDFAAITAVGLIALPIPLLAAAGAGLAAALVTEPVRAVAVAVGVANFGTAAAALGAGAVFLVGVSAFGASGLLFSLLGPAAQLVPFALVVGGGLLALVGPPLVYGGVGFGMGALVDGGEE
jgi:hypothetical protein